MYFIGVDLGSTNIKVAIYSKDMKLVDRQSYPVEYIRGNGLVEFDADLYCGNIMKLIGSMIEVPRAALQAAKLAEYADFFSFGTNDLTQMTFAFSRDDAVKFLPSYLDQEVC